MSINIGNGCIECHKDTSEGSGRFVNRIPADNDVFDGYMCHECQLIECDRCRELKDDCSGYSHIYICGDCVFEAGQEYLEGMNEDQCKKFLYDFKFKTEVA